MIEWLLGPVDVSRAHEVGQLVSWHGRLMVLAWGGLLPLGVLIARFFKVLPKQDWPDQIDNRLWWYSHQLLQYAGFAAVLAGLVAILMHTGISGRMEYHRICGYAVVLLCLLQVLSGWFRGSRGGPDEKGEGGSIAGDHYDMTPRRKVFEVYHKSMGYAAILLACTAIVSGLWEANAPRWMWIAIGSWWLVLTIAFVCFQRNGMTIDTYQAIWGTDSVHPGNRLRPIGWGVRRWERDESVSE